MAKTAPEKALSPSDTQCNSWQRFTVHFKYSLCGTRMKAQGNVFQYTEAQRRMKITSEE